MRKIILLLSIVVISVSCSSPSSKFSGVWYDASNLRNGLLVIEQQGNNVVVNIDNKKYVGKINDDVLEINVSGLTMNALIDENNNLILDGKTATKLADNIEELLEPKKIGILEWGTKQISIALNNPNQEIILPNGERLYSFDGAKKIANLIDGWRLPTKQDFENTLSNIQNNHSELHSKLNLKNHYGEKGRVYEGDKEVIGGCWTSTSVYRRNKYKRDIVKAIEHDGKIEYDIEGTDYPLFFSINLIKE